MNRFVDFFKNLKLPKVGRPSVRQIVFWIAALALAVGLYIFTNDFVTCWQFTTLDGIPPASCNVESNVLGTPVLNAQGTPIVRNTDSGCFGACGAATNMGWW